MEGFSKINNEFLDWMTAQVWLSGLDSRILILIVRKTIGWNKNSDKISFRQIKKHTGASFQGIEDSLKRLQEHGAISVHRLGIGKPNIYKPLKCGCMTAQVQQSGTAQVQQSNKRNKETKQKGYKQIFKNGNPIYIEI